MCTSAEERQNNPTAYMIYRIILPQAEITSPKNLGAGTPYNRRSPQPSTCHLHSVCPRAASARPPRPAALLHGTSRPTLTIDRLTRRACIQTTSSVIDMARNLSTRIAYKQPSECASHGTYFPQIKFEPDSTPNFFAQVPLYQPENVNTDISHVLQSCCHYKTWTYSDPEACTVICNSDTLKEATDVQYCLNAHSIRYGAVENAGGVRSISPAGSLWGLLLVGGLVLSQAIF